VGNVDLLYNAGLFWQDPGLFRQNPTYIPHHTATHCITLKTEIHMKTDIHPIYSYICSDGFQERASRTCTGKGSFTESSAPFTQLRNIKLILAKSVMRRLGKRKSSRHTYKWSCGRLGKRKSSRHTYKWSCGRLGKRKSSSHTYKWSCRRLGKAPCRVLCEKHPAFREKSHIFFGKRPTSCGKRQWTHHETPQVCGKSSFFCPNAHMTIYMCA